MRKSIDLHVDGKKVMNSLGFSRVDNKKWNRTFVGLVSFLLLVGVSSCSQMPASSKDVSDETSVTVIKSENDKRQYEYLVLDNRLKVLLISDPDSDKAAAALDVNVGSGEDPIDRPGLAHFLEHMLFLGTEKYPESGEYQSFLDENGGSHNAYTSFGHTNYFFEVAPDKLEGALDRFSQFFVAPLFTSKYVEREKHAVDSEYKAKIKEDGRRRDDVFKTTLNPAHPLSKFSVGSLEVFKEENEGDLRNALLAFYQKNYSANVMGLVVSGKESLPDLKKMVVDRFATIPNHNVELTPLDVPFYEAGRLPNETHMVPLKESRLLNLRFPIPPHEKYYRSKPLQYIGNILGHEGEGSLLSLLKRKGWAEALSAGMGRTTRHGGLFSVGMSLTEQGLEHSDEIIGMVFQTLNRIRQSGPQEWLFDEVKTVNDISFRFQEKYSPSAYVRQLADSIHLYDPEDVLRGAYIMEEYQPELISQFLAEMTPENVIVVLAAPGLKTDARSKYYDAAYMNRVVSAQRLKEWQSVGLNDEITLPSVNEFLPDEVRLAELSDTAMKREDPVVLKETDGLKLWYKQDIQYRVPKGDFYLSVRSPIVGESAETAALTELYIGLVNDQLNEFGYPANLAGLHYSVSKHSRGYSLDIHGYTDKQKKLLAQITDTLKNFTIDPKRFRSVKTELMRGWRNFDKRIPYHQVMGRLPDALYQVHYTQKELLAALEKKTPLELRKFVKRLYDTGVTSEGLVHGNYTESDAIALADFVVGGLLEGNRVAAANPVKVVKLVDDSSPLWPIEVDHADSVVVWYLQGRDDSAATRAFISLSVQALKSAYYQDLRTEKQLGYIVFNGAMPMLKVPGAVYVVQSPKASSSELIGYVEAFFSGYQSVLENMGEAQFEQYRQSLLTLIREEPKNLQQHSQRYWRHVILKDYQFSRREELLSAVEELTYSDFLLKYKQSYLAKNRNDLWVTSIKPGTEATDKKALGQGRDVIDSIDQFHKGKTYFELP